jgi:hypothetical protein
MFIARNIENVSVHSGCEVNVKLFVYMLQYETLTVK